MVTLMFDTHAFIQRLKSSGFNEPQAEALSSALKEVYDTAWHEIATKHDVAELNAKIDSVSAELNAKIDSVSTELNHGLQAVQLRVDARFETLKGEINLLKWMGGVVLAALVSLVLKAFFLSG